MYSNQNSTTSLKSFNVLQKLGQGSFASVYKVQRVDDKKIYAMKKVKIAQMKQKQRDNALNQVRVLASISHPNIVNYKQAFFDDATESLCIVMQYADAGDIQKKINQHLKNHTHFNQVQIWQAFIQMAKGLKALHQINILHRDLKCANIFCTKDNKYKLGDLNVSKVAKRGMARTQTGTPYYTSPQVWKDKPYDSKCDIWSLGCVIYQMAALSPPFRANNLKQLYTKIQRGIFQRIPAFYSDDLAQIINLCLRVTPSLRPSAIQLLQNPKLAKNTPTSQKYALDNDHTKKVNLINTILCPRNLKSLKMALPGAKYEPQNSIQKNKRPSSIQINRQQNGSQRSLSARNNLMKPTNQNPIVANNQQNQQKQSPYINRYAVQRKPSEKNILPIFAIKRQNSNSRQKERQKSKERQRSRQISRQRQREKQRQRQKQRQKQRQRQRQRQKQRQRLKQILIQNNRHNSKLVRNYSADLLKKRRQSSRSLQNNSSRRRDQKSIQNNQKVNIFMQDIANKCKNIKQRMELLMANKQREPINQKIQSNNQRRYLIPLPNSRNYAQKRQSSVKSSQQSRRNSKQVRNVYIPESQRVSNGNSSRSIQRNASSQRLQKQQRQDSKKIIQNKKVSPYLYYRR